LIPTQILFIAPHYFQSEQNGNCPFLVFKQVTIGFGFTVVLQWNSDNEVPRDWEYVFVVTGVRYVELLFHTFYYYWAEKGRSLCRGSLERFSNECRKTKTKVITSANHNRHKLSNEPIRTRSKHMLLASSAGKNVRARASRD